MRIIWHITLHNLRITASDKVALVWLIVMPLVFTTAAGLALRGGGGGSDSTKDIRFALTVADTDNGPRGQELLAAITAAGEIDLIPIEAEENRSLEDIARQLVEDGERSSALLIPRNYSEQLESGGGATLTFFRNPGRMNPLVTKQALGRVVARHNVALMAEGGIIDALRLVRDRPAPELSARLVARADSLLAEALNEPAIAVRGERIGRPEAKIPEMGFTHSSPAMALMFVLLNGLMLSTVLVTERRERTLLRLFTAPITRGQVITANLLWRFLIGLAQMWILILFGRFVFGVDWGDTPAGLVIVSAAYVAAVAGFSVLIGSLSRTSKQAESLSLLLTLMMCALGGLWWPLEITPGSYQAIGHLLPTGWAMDAMNNMLSRGYPLELVLPQAFVLLGFAVVLGVAATIAFKCE
ncbi:ABC transporter permease [bacterium]|nr:ABC transporter permease [bacterium]